MFTSETAATSDDCEHEWEQTQHYGELACKHCRTHEDAWEDELRERFLVRTEIALVEALKSLISGPAIKWLNNALEDVRKEKARLNNV